MESMQNCGCTWTWICTHAVGMCNEGELFLLIIQVRTMCACLNLNDVSSFHRHNLGQGGVSLCCGSWAVSGLCAACTASHGSHYRRLPGRVCPQDLGDMAEKERRLGKRCCLTKLAPTHADQKISQLMKARVPPMQLWAEKRWMRFSSTATTVLLMPLMGSISSYCLLVLSLTASAALILSFLCSYARLIQPWLTRTCSVPDLHTSGAASQS